MAKAPEDRPGMAHGREELFDLGDEYDAMLGRGLRLTGEDKTYFVQGRLALLSDALPDDFRPVSILDFGCGTGQTSAALATAFPGSRVTGVDTAGRAIEYASTNHSGPSVSFCEVADLGENDAFDLCYVNGVFHHIPPRLRGEALGLVGGALRPGGMLALFENNPWNPGTRLVMRRIPFDRDADPISPRGARRLLEANGFHVNGAARHLFFFPAALRTLRRMEPFLTSIPFGGQYLFLATSGAGS